MKKPDAVSKMFESVLGMKEKNNIYLLGIVLDTTLSFASVYPQIYYFLERLMISLRQIREDNKKITLRYALTLLNNEPEQVQFSDSLITDDENRFLEALSEIVLFGGSSDGEENLTKAAGHMLERIGQKETALMQKGLIFISDAFVENDRFADLTQLTGLRFAYVFSGDGEYMPQFRIVNEKGHLTENENNICIYASLTELLKKTEEKEVRMAEKLAKEIIMRFA